MMAATIYGALAYAGHFLKTLQIEVVMLTLQTIKLRPRDKLHALACIASDRQSWDSDSDLDRGTGRSLNV